MARSNNGEVVDGLPTKAVCPEDYTPQAWEEEMNRRYAQQFQSLPYISSNGRVPFCYVAAVRRGARGIVQHYAKLTYRTGNLGVAAGPSGWNADVPRERSDGRKESFPATEDGSDREVSLRDAEVQANPW